MLDNNKTVLIVALPISGSNKTVQLNISAHHTQLIARLKRDGFNAQSIDLMDLLKGYALEKKFPNIVEVLIPLIYLTDEVAIAPEVNQLIDFINNDNTLTFRYVDKDGVTFKYPKPNVSSIDARTRQMEDTLHDVKQNMKRMQMQLNELHAVTRGQQVCGNPLQAFDNPLGAGFGGGRPFGPNPYATSITPSTLDRVLILMDSKSDGSTAASVDSLNEKMRLPWAADSASYTIMRPTDVALATDPFQDFVLINLNKISINDVLKCLSSLHNVGRFVIVKTSYEFSVLKTNEATVRTLKILESQL